jgi:ribosomal protein S18 acetylase RimI-like enzyme
MTAAEDTNVFVVRRAVGADLATAADVAVGAFLADGPLSHDQRLLADAMLTGEVDGVYVAVDHAGVIVGTACLFASTSDHAHVAVAGECELRLLAVRPDCRGQHVGEALLRGCAWLASYNGAHALVLSAQPTRAAARKLYERVGFGRLADRDWHRDGIDLLAYGIGVDTLTGRLGAEPAVVVAHTAGSWTLTPVGDAQAG